MSHANTGTRAGFDLESVESAVASASRAPSIHNTQPWRWELGEDVLDLRADRSRQLPVADRDGHSLLISCGAAAQLTDLALRASGWRTERSYLPDPRDPDLLVRFRALGRSHGDSVAAARLAAAQRRRSERRPFGPGTVSAAIIEQLRRVAADSDVYAHFPVRPEEKLDLAVAISHADRAELDDPDYTAELTTWVRRDDHSPDGVPASVIPQLPPGTQRHTDIPVRDFEVGISGSQLISAGTDEVPLITVIFSENDDAREQLRAGEAMMRLMIEAELVGIASCPLSQSVDLPAFRARLQSLMSWTGHPQMMLRLGMRPAGDPAPLTSRRPVADVLTQSRPTNDGTR
jgi:nitroreductase